MSGEAVVTRQQVLAGAQDLGIAGQPICIHLSLRSFPKLEGGAATLIDVLLETGATVLVATMANQAFSIPPPPDDRPARNGMDYAARDRMAAERPWPGESDIYDHTRTEVDTWLGATSAYVAARPDRIRCRRPVGSFSALGPLARDLIDAEEERDVYGPLRALAARSGWVVLMGVSLTSMTLLHPAEVESGRRPFIRWARGADGRPVRERGGECSNGFDGLAPALAPIERRDTVAGASGAPSRPVRRCGVRRRRCGRTPRSPIAPTRTASSAPMRLPAAPSRPRIERDGPKRRGVRPG